MNIGYDHEYFSEFSQAVGNFEPMSDQTVQATFECLCRDQTETERLANLLAIQVGPGTCLCLNGDLGAGKTCFVRAFAAALGVNPEQVNSPTYVILQHYLGDVIINHFDWYRIEQEEELYETGADEFIESNGISLIEWSDKFPQLLPDDRLVVTFTVIDTTSRRIKIEGFTADSVKQLAGVEEAWE